MTTANTNQPIDHVRFGAVQAAIWKNTDPEDRVRYGVTIERLYKDAEGKWNSTASFGRDELLLVAKVADRANTRIFELQAADREQGSENSTPAKQKARAAKGGGR